MLQGIQRCKQMSHRESQSICDAEEAQHRDVALALLNLPDIRFVETRSGGECPLRQASLLPVLMEGDAKESKEPVWIAWLQEGRDMRRYHHIPHLAGSERSRGCGRSKRSVGIEPSKQKGGRQIQGMRKAKQHQHQNIALTEFDLADICVRYTRPGSEHFLCKPSLLPIFTNSCTQEL